MASHLANYKFFSRRRDLECCFKALWNTIKERTSEDAANTPLGF